MSRPPVLWLDHCRLMAAAVSHFQGELGKIHTGRASPGVLEVIEVAAHNERLPLKALATVTARNATTLVVTPHNPAVRITRSQAQAPMC